MKISPLRTLRMLAPIFSWFYATCAVILVAGQKILIPFLFGTKTSVTVFPFSLLLLPALTAAAMTFCCYCMPRVERLWPEMLGICLSAGPLVLLQMLLVHIEGGALESIGQMSAAIFTYLSKALRYCDFVSALASALFLVACGMSITQKSARKDAAQENEA